MMNMRVGWSIAIILTIVAPGMVYAVGQTSVDSGYDLFQTQDGTFFNFGTGPVPLMGVPLGTYNFGGTIGVQNVGDTDTIVQRLSNASVSIPSIPSTAPTISTQLLALDMETTAPINIGAGLHFYFITLQSDHGGPVSTGSMDITFASTSGGTFNSSFDVFFDIRQDALNGAVVNSTDLTLSQTGDTWGRTPPPGAVTINGVNQKLNGVDTTTDFWPGVPFTESHAGAGAHVVSDALVPEPSSLCLLGLGGLYMLLRKRGLRGR